MIFLRKLKKLQVVLIGLFVLTVSCDKDDSFDSSIANEESKVNTEKTGLAKVSKLDIADGPSSMGSSMVIEWEYTGLELESIGWWYRKVGGQASYFIGSGSVIVLTAIPDTYYSNENNEYSEFVIYLQGSDNDGTIFRSMDYRIHKKGAFKLIGTS